MPSMKLIGTDMQVDRQTDSQDHALSHADTLLKWISKIVMRIMNAEYVKWKMSLKNTFMKVLKVGN